jgi:alpha-tubulin suppressor-like RCC1 family protein
MSNATINTPIKFVHFLGSGIEIKDIPLKNNISNILAIADNGVDPQSWTNGFAFNSLTQIKNNKGYIVTSKISSSFPYNLYSESDSSLTTVILDKQIQIAEYRGSPVTLDRSTLSLSFDSVVGIGSDGVSPESWTNGFAFNSLSTLSSGNVYLFYNKSGNLPITLWPNSDIIRSPTPTPTPTPTPLPPTASFDMYVAGPKTGSYHFRHTDRKLFTLGNKTHNIAEVTTSVLDKTTGTTKSIGPWSQISTWGERAIGRTIVYSDVLIISDGSPTVYGNTLAIDLFGKLYSWGSEYGIVPALATKLDYSGISLKKVKKVAMGPQALGFLIDIEGKLFRTYKKSDFSMAITNFDLPSINNAVDIVVGGYSTDPYVEADYYAPYVVVFVIDSSNRLYRFDTQIGKSILWDKVKVGYDHVLGISTSGKLYQWDAHNPLAVPSRIGTASNWTDIAAGNNFSLAVNSDGEMYIWGQSSYMFPGDNNWKIYKTIYNRETFELISRTIPSPQKITSKNNWTKVYASPSDLSAAAIDENNELYTWGINTWEDSGNVRLGDDGVTKTSTFNKVKALRSTNSDKINNCSSPHRVGEFIDWHDVSMGAGILYGLASGTPSPVDNSGLFGFGSNLSGQVGYGTAMFPLSSAAKIDLENDWDDISCSFNSSIGIKSGKLYGWGTTDNNILSSGIAGTGSPFFTAPKELPGYLGSSWSGVSCSTNGTKDIALLINDSQELYQLGTVFNKVSKNGDLNLIHTAITGYKASTFTIPANTSITGSTGYNTNIMISGDVRNLYVETTGTIFPDGIGNSAVSVNSYGISDLGNTGRLVNITQPAGNTNSFRKGALLGKIGISGIPFYIGNRGSSDTYISSGFVKTFTNLGTFEDSLPTTGLLYLGIADDNYSSNVGNFLVRFNCNLVQYNVNNWTQISAGTDHYIGISNGKLYAGGSNFYGQLGINSPTFTAVFNQDNSTDTSFNITPILTSNSSWIKVSAGDRASAAIDSNNDLYVCGTSSYLGLGLTSSTSTPWTKNSFNGLKWKEIAVGYDHMLAITIDGDLYAWGKNLSGQIGDETFDTRYIPTLILPDKHNWTKIAAAYSTSFAIDETGQVYSWGSNLEGACGGGPDVEKINIPTEMLSVGTSETYSSNAYHPILYDLNSVSKVVAGGLHGFIINNMS